MTRHSGRGRPDVRVVMSPDFRRLACMGQDRRRQTVRVAHAVRPAGARIVCGIPRRSLDFTAALTLGWTALPTT